MTMVYAGGYDLKGEIVTVVAAGSLADAVLCLTPHLAPTEPGYDPCVDWIEVPDDRAGETHYVEDQIIGAEEDRVLVDRPVIGLPTTHEMEAGEWHLPDVPAGTVVVIDGTTVATTDTPGLTLTGSTPFTVELDPPFPWRGATCRVSIAE